MHLSLFQVMPFQLLFYRFHMNPKIYFRISLILPGMAEHHTQDKLVLCQDLVQVKMRNFSDFNPPEAQPQCVFFYTIVRIHLVTYSYNGYEFVSYCRKLPDIRKSSSMPACNREF